jgi:WD40 repeat protein
VDKGVESAVFSPNGSEILTASTDRTARLWDLAGKELAVFRGHEDYVTSAIFSPDGSSILTASFDGTARLWTVSGRELVVFKGHDSHLWSARFSPSGTRILTASADSTARIWDLSGKQIAVFPGKSPLKSAEFSRDGRWILTSHQTSSGGGYQEYRVWEVNGREPLVLRGRDAPFVSACFSPDGSTILTTGANGSARLWDLHGRSVSLPKAHRGSVLSGIFSADGSKAITTSSDGTLALERGGLAAGGRPTHQQGLHDGGESAVHGPA